MLGLSSPCRRLNVFSLALQYGEFKYLNKYVDKRFADACVAVLGAMYEMSKLNTQAGALWAVCECDRTRAQVHLYIFGRN